MWPRAGAWAASETDDTMSSCSPPDPLTRCLGWNATVGASECGPGYLQGSFLCGSCETGFYGDPSGACAPCPVLASSWQRYAGVIFVILVVVALVVFVWAVLVLLVKLRGGTIMGGARRLVSLAVWALLAAQVSVCYEMLPIYPTRMSPLRCPGHL